MRRKKSNSGLWGCAAIVIVPSVIFAAAVIALVVNPAPPINPGSPPVAVADNRPSERELMETRLRKTYWDTIAASKPFDSLNPSDWQAGQVGSLSFLLRNIETRGNDICGDAADLRIVIVHHSTRERAKNFNAVFGVIATNGHETTLMEFHSLPSKPKDAGQ